MDCGVILSKNMWLLISLLWASFSLTYIGEYVVSTYETYDFFLQDKYAHLLAYIIICVGMVMVIIGILAHSATIRESKVGQRVFLVIVLMLFVAEVSAFVLGFIYRGKIKTDLHEPMVQTFKVYDGKSEKSQLVDYIQRELQCCGILNYTDWIGSQWYNSSGKNNSVPLSCCNLDVIKNCTGRLSEPKFLNTQGCEDKVKSILQRALSLGMVVILGFAIVKFYGMLSICVLAHKRESDVYQPFSSGGFA